MKTTEETQLFGQSQARAMWAKIGLLSFGGPAGQIALMHREVIEERALISEREFLSALNFCMLLPGPEAMQLATYIGWKLHGWRGGLTAGLLFVLPGAVVMFVLAMLYALFGNVPLIDKPVLGRQGGGAGHCACRLCCAWRSGRSRARRIMPSRLLAFIALFAFALPFPLVIGVAAVLGFLLRRAGTRGIAPTKPSAIWQDACTRSHCGWPLACALLVLNVLAPTNTLTGLGNFFSSLSVVTFGGAYAVLSYMGQDVVEAHHWLTAPQMMDGLGLAETTPGPLILVGQFVGVLPAAKAQGSLWAGLLGGVVYLWMTFAPCFLWIFVGAPYIEFLQTIRVLPRRCAQVTAAVTGVILNLSFWFGLHVLFGQVTRHPGPVPIWLPRCQRF